MTTVVKMEVPVSRRNKSSDAGNEFRIDVINYGAVFYNALKKRKDFGALQAKESRARRPSKEAVSAD